jgi:hypothetical protein
MQAVARYVIIAAVIATTSLIAVSMTPAFVTAATCHQFDIVIDSQVSSNYGSVQNRVREIAIVRDQGVRNNSFELLIRYPGDLNGFDVRSGIIELMTNSAFARNPGMASAGFDLGSTMHRGNTFAFQLDQGAAFQLPPPNVFVAPGVSESPGGLGGLCYAPGMQQFCQQLKQAPVLQAIYLVPGQGTVQFRFPNKDTIEGAIDIAGFGIDNSNLQAQYQASFRGRRTGEKGC